MPTTDPAKNLQYVLKSQARKKEAIGVEEFNRIHTEAQMKYKKKQREENTGEFLKKNADYMKVYMKEKRLKEKEAKLKAKSINTLTDAIRARKARQELAKLKAEREAKVVKRRRGRPVGSKNKKNQEEFKMELRPRPKKN